MNEMIVHDACMLLFEHDIKDKDMQEGILVRYLDGHKRGILENIMKHFGVWYDCNFNELQRLVLKENKKNMFEII